MQGESFINYLDSDAPRPVEIFRIPHYDAIAAGNPREIHPEDQMCIMRRARIPGTRCASLATGCPPDYLNGDIVLMGYALQSHDGDVVAALSDGTESTLKTSLRQGDEITLIPIETKRHSPRTFHASRTTIQGRSSRNRPPHCPTKTLSRKLIAAEFVLTYMPDLTYYLNRD